MDVTVVGTGPAGNIDVQVDPTANALRTSTRPLEHQQGGNPGGIYALVATYSSTAAKPAAASDVLSLRWTDSNLLFVLLRVAVSTITSSLFSAAGVQDVSLSVARAFTVSPSAGTQIIPLAGGQVVRSSNMKK